jgi:hypothetical protein
LQNLWQNLGYIENLAKAGNLTARLQTRLLVILVQAVYRQQKQIYDNHRHAVENRIVSVSQRWARPIVSGKLTTRTEFGAKLALSMENGYARIEKLSWNALNEAPKRILAEKRPFMTSRAYGAG